jgi:hypothetical protein
MLQEVLEDDDFLQVSSARGLLNILGMVRDRDPYVSFWEDFKLIACFVPEIFI